MAQKVIPAGNWTATKKGGIIPDPNAKIGLQGGSGGGVESSTMAPADYVNPNTLNPAQVLNGAKNALNDIQGIQKAPFNAYTNPNPNPVKMVRSTATDGSGIPLDQWPSSSPLNQLTNPYGTYGADGSFTAKNPIYTQTQLDALRNKVRGNVEGAYFGSDHAARVAASTGASGAANSTMNAVDENRRATMAGAQSDLTTSWDTQERAWKQQVAQLAAEWDMHKYEVGIAADQARAKLVNDSKLLEAQLNDYANKQSQQTTDNYGKAIMGANTLAQNKGVQDFLANALKSIPSAFASQGNQSGTQMDATPSPSYNAYRTAAVESPVYPKDSPYHWLTGRG